MTINVPDRRARARRGPRSRTPPPELVVTSHDDPLAAEFGGTPAPGTTVLVARVRSAAVGRVGLRRIGDGVAVIERPYVRPGGGGDEIARLLLAGAEELARQSGCTVARLDSGHPVRLGAATGHPPVPAPRFEKPL